MRILITGGQPFSLFYMSFPPTAQLFHKFFKTWICACAINIVYQRELAGTPQLLIKNAL